MRLLPFDKALAKFLLRCIFPAVFYLQKSHVLEQFLYLCQVPSPAHLGLLFEAVQQLPAPGLCDLIGEGQGAGRGESGSGTLEGEDRGPAARRGSGLQGRFVEPLFECEQLNHWGEQGGAQKRVVQYMLGKYLDIQPEPAQRRPVQFEEDLPELRVGAGRDEPFFAVVQRRDRAYSIFVKSPFQVKEDAAFRVEVPTHISQGVTLKVKCLLRDVDLVSLNYELVPFGSTAIYSARCKEEPAGEPVIFAVSSQFCLQIRAELVRSPAPYKGIPNEGNTCYANSLLQVLFSLKSFVKMVYDSRSAHPTMVALADVFSRLQQKEPVSTRKLLQSFGWKEEQMYQQRDIQEFKQALFTVLERELEDKQLFKQLFVCERKNTIRCVHVDYRSESKEEMPQLFVEVRQDGSVRELPELLAAPELLAGENQYETEEFGRQDAEKSSEVTRLPEVLFINLMRYKFTGAQVAKLTHRFTFGKDLCFGQEHYVLHAVISHEGDAAHYGHYRSFIALDSWVEFNDSSVSKVTEVAALTHNFGGWLQSFRYSYDAKGFVEVELPNYTTAYYLVYVNSKALDSVRQALPPRAVALPSEPSAPVDDVEYPLYCYSGSLSPQEFPTHKISRHELSLYAREGRSTSVDVFNQAVRRYLVSRTLRPVEGFQFGKLSRHLKEVRVVVVGRGEYDQWTAHLQRLRQVDKDLYLVD